MRGGRDGPDPRRRSDSVEVSGALPRVESTKYAAPLAETPQTIQVIPRTLLDEQGATTLTDALRNVPGITMQAGEGGGASNTSGDMFNMRGFSATNSLFVDGVRDDGLIARDVFNLEQIEVFSGPTGSDVGRMNAAGYINLDDQAAESRRRAGWTLSYGAGDQVRATVDINQPISLRRAPERFSGMRRRSRQRAVAGRRRRRTRLRRAWEQVDRPVDRVRPRLADAAQRRGAGHAAGQPRRLRPPSRRVTSRPAHVDVGRRRDSGGPGRTTTAARTTTTTTSARTTSRSALEHDLAPAADDPQPDSLQHDRREKRSSRALPTRRPTTRRRISSR